MGPTLKTLLDSDQYDDRDSKQRKIGTSLSNLSPTLCKKAFFSPGPGVRWYLKYKPTLKMVGVSPPTEVDLVLRLSRSDQGAFLKGHRAAFYNVFRVLHFQEPKWETEDETPTSSFHLLGQVSELSWVLGCQKAIAPMIKLAQFSPPSDTARSSLISRIRMALVWKNSDEFRKATRQYIFQMQDDKEELLGTGSLESQEGKIEINEPDEMGVMAVLQRTYA